MTLKKFLILSYRNFNKLKFRPHQNKVRCGTAIGTDPIRPSTKLCFGAARREIVPSRARPIWWLPVIFWAGLIFYFSSLPNLRISEIDLLDLISRKLAHLIEFFILTILIFRALAGSLYRFNKKVFIFGIIFAFLYALSDEFHQSFVPGRSANLFDISIDSIGIFAACSLILSKFKKNYIENR